jgi:hypothetical protein
MPQPLCMACTACAPLASFQCTLLLLFHQDGSAGIPVLTRLRMTLQRHIQYMLRPSCCVLCLMIFGVVGGGAG